jgi:uncharacterized protein YecT (DUF1311 family)
VSLFLAFLRKVSSALIFAVLLPALSATAKAQESMSPSQPPAPVERRQDPQAQEPPPPPSRPAPPSPYDKAIFLKAIPAAQLAFMNQFAGAPSSDLYQDRDFHKLMKTVMPDCMFHYGRDMPLSDALDLVFKGSRIPVHIRDGRYLSLAGNNGPILAGRGFIWIDLKDGVGVGGFYFHPTNGEPTPSVNIFSRQIKDEALSLGDLPPAFAEDFSQWAGGSSVPSVTTRYFLTGSNKKVLLEHDEDFCSPTDGTIAPNGDECEQMNADAADDDMTAASYLDQTHHATNATAWMINDPEQVAWLRVRDRTCGGVVDPLGCRIRITRERTHVIIHRSAPPHR